MSATPAHGIDERANADWTIRRVLGWATNDFRARGIESARLDAELLLSHALGKDRIFLILEAEKTLGSAELSLYRELIKRRRSGEPIAYLVGEREFFGLRFRIDRSALIPRPDTETLVEVALDRTRDHAMHGRALDLCTGSGCVAIAFARQRPTWQVTGVDLCEPAVALSRENALRLGTIWGVRFLAGDLFEPLPSSERYDLITANPPYIPSAQIEELDVSIRDFEPSTALDGGPDGLVVTRRIVAGAASRLSPGGVLAIEVGAGFADAVSAVLEATGFHGIERRNDYGGHERVVSGALA